jgi:hypothetical protein
MSERYRVEVVEAPSMDPARALQQRLNSIGYNEQVKAILPYAETGGWTTKYLIVIEPITQS